MYGPAASTIIEPHVTLQKAAIRQVFAKGHRAHTGPLFHSANKLRVQQLYIERLLLKYCIKPPQEILDVINELRTGQQRETRQAARGHIRSEWGRLSRTQKCSEHIYLKNYNHLPPDLKLPVNNCISKRKEIIRALVRKMNVEATTNFLSTS